MRPRHYLAFAVVVVLTIVILKLPARTATQFKLAIGGFFLPLFGLAGSTQQAAEQAGNAVIPRQELLRQNDDLRRENAELKVQLQRETELERQNNRLNGMLGFQQNSRWKIKPAHVIARDPANWWRNIQIDLGERDGARVDLPVLTAEGLVGRISEVSKTRSRVVLLGDANCRVPAMVIDTQGRTVTTVDHGVITGGAGVLDESIVEMGYLSQASAVKPGQQVRTSSYSAIYPPGILIGEVIDARPANFELVTVARVKLAAKMNSLEEVWVVMP
jgi:rod shape-determining protein MreC